MTNKEMIAAIEKIAHAKVINKQATELRKNVIAEIRKRGKTKINLGGPTKEDYIKLIEYMKEGYEVRSHKVAQLSYRVSSDDSNMLRGIDL